MRALTDLPMVNPYSESDPDDFQKLVQRYIHEKCSLRSDQIFHSYEPNYGKTPYLVKLILQKFPRSTSRWDDFQNVIMK